MQNLFFVWEEEQFSNNKWKVEDINKFYHSINHIFLSLSQGVSKHEATFLKLVLVINVMVQEYTYIGWGGNSNNCNNNKIWFLGGKIHLFYSSLCQIEELIPLLHTNHEIMSMYIRKWEGLHQLQRESKNFSYFYYLFHVWSECNKLGLFTVEEIPPNYHKITKRKKESSSRREFTALTNKRHLKRDFQTTCKQRVFY